MNLFKTIKNKKVYLNNRSFSDYGMGDKMFCASCERPFVVGDYLVRLKLNKGKFEEVITCSQHDCEGDFDDWIEPDIALFLLEQIYEEKDLTIPERTYYNALIRLVKNIVKSDCSKTDE